MKTVLKTITALSVVFLVSCGGEGTAQEDQHSETTQHHNEQKSQTIAKNINVSEFKKLIENNKGSIVDVRTPGEFNRGNIAGAKNINISGNFSTEIQKLDKTKPVYVYCAVGGRSSRAMQMMTTMGFKEVYNLSGGYNAWSK